MSPSRTSASGPPTIALRGDVQNAGAIGGAAHARIGDAHHVANAALQDLLRDGKQAPLRHAGSAQRPGILKDENGILVDIKIVAVDARFHIVEVVEDHRRAGVLPEARGRRRPILMTAPSGASDPKRIDRAAGLHQRLGALANHVCGSGRPRLRDSRPMVFPFTVRQSRSRRSRNLGHQRAQSAGVVEIFHQIFAGGTNVGEHRNVTRDFIEARKRQIEAETAGDRDEMNDGVGRAADGHVDGDGVADRLRA